jgi:hypothetical protein
MFGRGISDGVSEIVMNGLKVIRNGRRINELILCWGS